MFTTCFFVGLLITISFGEDVISSSTEDLTINIVASGPKDGLRNITNRTSEEREYFGKKPNWDIYSCHEYNYIPQDPATVSDSDKSVPINTDIVFAAFNKAGVDLDKYRNSLLYIIDLDLSHMVERILYEKSFETESACNYAINEYKKFLILYVYLTATSTSNITFIVPSVLVDKLWQWHVLDVEKYIFDCIQIIGHVIPHSSRFNIANDKWLSRFDEVLIAYKNVFGYPSPTQTCSEGGFSFSFSDSELELNETTFNFEIKEIDINAISKVFISAGIDFNEVSDGILHLIDLDLSSLIPTMISENGYKNEEECKFALNEYKKYFIIYMYLRGISTMDMDYVKFGNFVPPFPVDLVWHCHILHLEKYIDDSMKILGQIFYHNPRFHLQVNQFPEVQTPKYAKLFEAYPIIFGYDAPFQMWGDDASIAAQCCGGGVDPAQFFTASPIIG